VLLDLGLPGMTGLEVAEELRKRDPAPLLIAVTGYGRASDREDTAAAGFAHHLVKPVQVAKVVALLKESAKKPGPAPTPTRPAGDLSPPP
jgi:CheY-like chemotaxis protein